MVVGRIHRTPHGTAFNLAADDTGPDAPDAAAAHPRVPRRRGVAAGGWRGADGEAAGGGGGRAELGGGGLRSVLGPLPASPASPATPPTAPSSPTPAWARTSRPSSPPGGGPARGPSAPSPSPSPSPRPCPPPARPSAARSAPQAWSLRSAPSPLRTLRTQRRRRRRRSARAAAERVAGELDSEGRTGRCGWRRTHSPLGRLDLTIMARAAVLG
jgi:hypothetical protein